MRPIVKWAGGKGALLGELLARLPSDIRTYAEPFAGGAALFFALATEVDEKKRTVGHVVLADSNLELVTCYRAVKRDVDAVIEALKTYRYDRELYYLTREKDPESLSDVERAARLLFLNRTCFNGLWRVNASGKFNVPFGSYKNPRILDEEGLRAASRALERADIVHGDFTEATRGLGAGDFAYFDPPYAPLSRTAAFTAYAAGGFGPEDQHRLMAEVKRLHGQEVLCMLSNADTPDMRALYRDFAVSLVFAPRSINSKGTGRGDAREILVTSWGYAGVKEQQLPLRERPASGRRAAETARRPAGKKAVKKRVAAKPARKTQKTQKKRPRRG